MSSRSPQDAGARSSIARANAMVDSGTVKSVLLFCLLSIAVLSGVVGAQTDNRPVVGIMSLDGNNVAEQRRFWVSLLGGTLGRMTVPPGHTSPGIVDGGFLVVLFPDFIVDLGPGPGTGGPEGTTFEHTAFRVPNLQALVGKLNAAGFPNITTPDRTQREIAHALPGEQSPPLLAFIKSAEGVPVVFIEDRTLTTPIALHHVHLAAPPGKLHEMTDWYTKQVDATVGRRGADYRSLDVSLIAGALVISESTTPVVGTKGRVVRHFGFRLRDLPAFYKRQLDRGLTFSRPMAFGGHDQSQAIYGPDWRYAFATDPAGTEVEFIQYTPRTFEVVRR